MPRLPVAILCLLLGGAAEARPRVLCTIGDSLVAGGPILAGNPSWSSLLGTERVGQKFGVINLGVGGYTIAQAQAIFESEYEGHGCTHAVVLVGTNRLAQSASAETAFSELEALVAVLRADTSGNPSGINVTVCTIPPRGGSSGWTGAMETERRALNTFIRDEPGWTVVDLDDLGCGGDPEEMCAAYRTADLLHLNGTPTTGGSAKVAELINAVVSW